MLFDAHGEQIPVVEAHNPGGAYPNPREEPSSAIDGNLQNFCHSSSSEADPWISSAPGAAASVGGAGGWVRLAAPSVTQFSAAHYLSRPSNDPDVPRSWAAPAHLEFGQTRARELASAGQPKARVIPLPALAELRCPGPPWGGQTRV